MFTLLRKEISGFFSSLIGYIVIVVFLMSVGLFMWVIPGDLNILDNGYASVETLFLIAPWVFLFLVPAVTMRLFAEEKRGGTLELLLTRPLTDLKIVVSKYFSGLFLVLIALLPTLVYYLAVWLLGNPVGNVDAGGTWGSYIGLFFLASVYVAIGVFSSSVTENQIVSFILSVVLCFLFFIGFEFLSDIDFLKEMKYFLVGLGINDHYTSMSRGVIDTRDVVYFLSIIALFVFLTKVVLESRKW